MVSRQSRSYRSREQGRCPARHGTVYATLLNSAASMELEYGSEGETEQHLIS
jgi:hypothetical protein